MSSDFKNIRDRKAKLKKRLVGPPQFKDRFVAKDSFRLRNTNGKRYKVTKKGVTVPLVGYLRLREGTARLRSLMREGRDFAAGRILAGTLSIVDGYWRLSLNLEVDARAITQRQWPAHEKLVQYPVIGCDLGINTLACLATPDGSFVQHSLAPAAVDGARKTIQGHQRRRDIKREASRQRAKEAKTKGRLVGKSEERASERYPRRARRQRNIRRLNLHHLTIDLPGRCDVIGIEDLNIAGMLKTTVLREPSPSKPGTNSVGS